MSESSLLLNKSSAEARGPNIYIVTVDRVSADHKGPEPWPIFGQPHVSWLQTKLQCAIQEAKVWKFLPSQPKETSPLWDILEDQASELLEFTSGLRPEAPILFICKGLGGLVALRALHELQEGSFTSCPVPTQFMRFAFFGTPLNHQRRKEFTNAIRYCGQLERGHTNDNKEVENLPGLEKCVNWIRQLEGMPGQFVTICETTATKLSGNKWFKGEKVKLVVGPDIATCNGGTVIKSPGNHHDVGTYNEEAHVEIQKLALGVCSAYADSKKVVRMQTSFHNISSELTPAAQTTPRTRFSQSSRAGTLNTLAPGGATSSASSINPINTDFHHIDFPYNALFVGRSQTLKNIHKALVDDAPRSRPLLSTSRAYALFGQTGMGKSQTAREFVEENRNHFPHILWVYADTEIKIQTAYSEFAFLLNISDPSAGPQAAAAALKKWFGKADQPWLVVLDNAEDKELIIRWWPRGPAGSVLITTVNPVFATITVAGCGGELKQLDEEEAEMMITKELYSETDLDTITNNMKAEARELAQRTNFHPLLIKHCLGDLHERQCTLDYYNRQPWESKIFVGTENRINRVYAPYEHTLPGSLRQRVEILDEASRSLIDVFSLLDPDNISTDLFESPQITKWPQDILRMPFVSDFAACRARVTKGLVSHRGRDKHGREFFALHRVNRDFLWHSMTRDTRKIAFDAAVRLLLHAIDKDWIKANPSTGMHLSRRGLDHVIYRLHFINVEAIRSFFQEQYEAKAVSGQSSQDEDADNEAYLDMSNFLLLLSGTAWTCYATGLFKTGREYIELGQRILTRLSSNFQAAPTTSEVFERVTKAKLGLSHARACIATEQADFSDALEEFQKEENQLEDAIKKGYKMTDAQRKTKRMIILGGIANSYQGLGDQLKAEANYRKCLDLGRKNDINSAYEVNICRSMWARGAFDQAAARLNELITLRNIAKGKDDEKDYKSGHMRYVLGNVRISQAQTLRPRGHDYRVFMEEAFELHKSALKIWRATLGEGHHKTADAYHKVGWHLVQRQEYQEAKELFEKAILIYEQGSDPDLRQGEIARTKNQLSLVLSAVGDGSGASAMHNEAERIWQSLRGGSNSPRTPDGSEKYDELVSLWAR